MELELHHLRNLSTVGKVGSLNRAAALLELPQPALSRQVRRLEELLGGALFVRDQKGVRPTALGALVLQYADSIINVCDDLVQDLDAHRLNRSRTVRVGWATSMISDLLLNCLATILPTEKIEVQVGDSTSQLVEWLNNGELDLALVGPQATSLTNFAEGVSQVFLVEEPIFVSLPRGHRLASQSQVSVAQLANEEWVFAAGRDGCQRFLRSLCAPFGFDPEITHHVPVLGPREEIVSLQDAVTLVQATRPEHPGVVRRPLADVHLTTQHVLVYRNDSSVADHVPLLSWLFLEHYWDRSRACPAYDEWLVANGLRPESPELDVVRHLTAVTR